MEPTHQTVEHRRDGSIAHAQHSTFEHSHSFSLSLSKCFNRICLEIVDEVFVLGLKLVVVCLFVCCCFDVCFVVLNVLCGLLLLAVTVFDVVVE